MLRTFALALALAAPLAVPAPSWAQAPAPPPPPSQPNATLAVAGDDGAQYLVAIAPGLLNSGFFDFKLTVDCTGACPAPLHYEEQYPEVPLGLFQLRVDDGLIYAVGEGRIGYQVRAWRIASGAVTKVLEARSQQAPEFVTAPGGAAAVRTFDGEGGKLSPQLWTWRGGAFVQDAAPGRRTGARPPATVAPRPRAAR